MANAAVTAAAAAGDNGESCSFLLNLYTFTQGQMGRNVSMRVCISQFRLAERNTTAAGRRTQIRDRVA